jgi:phage terminase Nu1 subunit (DNA packaging protein)
MSVSAAIASGRLVKSVVRVGPNNVPKISDPDLADREWEANTDPVMRAAAFGNDPAAWHAPNAQPVKVAVDDAASDEPEVQRTESMPEVATSTARAKHWDAQLRELKYKEAAAELVPVANVTRRLIEVLTGTKQRLLAIPTRARQALPSLSNDDATVLEGLVREAIEDLERDPL